VFKGGAAVTDLLTPILRLPAVTKMTSEKADLFLDEYYPHLAERVEDAEVRGGTHFYYLEDGTVIKVNKHKAIHIDEDDTPLWLLAVFNQ
jgi:hypothetical protein